ncbi:hypothetical protein BJX66DRAFT_317871 [Aspergillus keveii]|uniref:Uncharacterized protein n=1 Tax=Aspergillus keveii TaxID=714993 RepID=A0ABR4FKP2_9EURO
MHEIPANMRAFMMVDFAKLPSMSAFRVVIDNDTFAVLMSCGKDLSVTRHLVASGAQLFRAVGSKWHDPCHPEKRLKVNTGASLAGPVQPLKDEAPTAMIIARLRKTEQHDGKIRPGITSTTT